MFTNFQLKKEKLALYNIYIAYLCLPFLPAIIPFYKIEPTFACHSQSYSDSFLIIPVQCDKENICNNECDSVSIDKSYFSFKTSYYLNHLAESEDEDKPIIQCNSYEDQLLDYFCLLYFFGIFLGNILFYKIRKQELWVCLTVSGSLAVHYAVCVVFLFHGVSFGLTYIIFTVNSGFFFFLYSAALVLRHAQMCNLIIKRNKVEDIAFGIDFTSALSAIIHLVIYHFWNSFFANFYLFFITSGLSYGIYLFLLIREKLKGDDINGNRNRNRNYSLRNDFTLKIENFDQFENFDQIDKLETNHYFKSASKPAITKNHSKSKLISNRSVQRVHIGTPGADESFHTKKKYKSTIIKLKKKILSFSSKHFPYMLNIILFFLTSSNYQLVNYYIDKYSYRQFEPITERRLFINGYIIYITELVSVITGSKATFLKAKKSQSYLYLCLVLLLGVCLMLVQVCIKNSNQLVLSLFICFSKFTSMYLGILLKNQFKRGEECGNEKSDRMLANVSRCSILLTLLINNTEFPFLILACMYYTCFILILKLNL